MAAKPQSVYYMMSIIIIIIYLLHVVNPSSTFVKRFKSLLAEYQSVCNGISKELGERTSLGIINHVVL